MPLVSSSNSHSMVELRAKAEGLVKMDTFSKSDPFARLTFLTKTGESEIGRTEVIQDTQSPSWHTAITAAYVFEEVQTIKVEVYDEDVKGSTNLKDHQLQGSACFLLSELMTSRTGSLTKDLCKLTGGNEMVSVRIPQGAQAGDRIQ